MMKKMIAILLVLCIMMTTLCFGTDKLTVNYDKGINMLTYIFATRTEEIPSLFTQEFIEKVTAQGIIKVITDTKSKLGKLIDIKKNEGMYNLEFQKGYLDSKISIRKDGKIDGLWFVKIKLKEDSMQSIIDDIDKLGNEYSICIKRNDKEIVFEKNKDEVMNVGSAYKLFVLKEVNRAIRANKYSWNKVIKLKDEHKSFPTGILQTWPTDTPVTIATLANLMISISDNTAADHLLDLVGKSKIERYMQKEHKPLLETNEMIRLKFTNNDEILKKYLEENESGKEKIIKQLKETVGLDAPVVANAPIAIKQIGYFFNTNDLCDVIYDLKDCDVLGINPGVVDEKQWYKAYFKGGSEPGVINLTQLLQKTEGSDVYTLSITFNNESKLVDTATTVGFAKRITDLIKNGGFIEKKE